MRPRWRSPPKPRKGQVCQAANDNGGGQVVVSGDKAAVERALEIAKTKGAKRAMLLPVSAPFHCKLMQPAADAMAEALADVTIKAPASPLVSNVLATPITDPDEIRRRLIEQVTGTVRWRKSVAYMAAHGVTRFFEIGAGKVLSGLVKRIADGAVGVSIGGTQRYCRCQGCIGSFGLELPEGDIDVRFDGQDGAGDRRDRRHRRRDRASVACAGRDGGAFPARAARCWMPSPASLASAFTCCRAICPTVPKSRRWCPRRKPRWGRSIF